MTNQKRKEPLRVTLVKSIYQPSKAVFKEEVEFAEDTPEDLAKVFVRTIHIDCKRNQD